MHTGNDGFALVHLVDLHVPLSASGPSAHFHEPLVTKPLGSLEAEVLAESLLKGIQDRWSIAWCPGYQIVQKRTCRTAGEHGERFLDHNLKVQIR